MALLRKINSKAKTEINTGFGINTSDYGGRYINKDGSPNIEKRGLGLLEKISWFHTMLAMPRWKFFLLIFVFFILINFVFAMLYMIIGVEHLSGMLTKTNTERFGEAYFFSAQTFTTVGYGRVNPTGFFASAMASFEALIGLLSFALATGLFYARFSKPKAYMRFSKNALIAPYRDGIALMMRVAPFKNTTLTDAEAKVSLGISLEENGKMVNKFFPLELEFDKVNALTLSWTIVHPITENSPLYTFTAEDYASATGEVLVYLKAFDDMYSNTVVTRTSYTFRELVIGAKFIPMYHRNSNGTSTILDFEKIGVYTPADISFAFAGQESVANG